MRSHESFHLNVDRSKCEGHGMCEQVAPCLIHLNEDAEPVFNQDRFPSADRALADAAVHSCPVAALSICDIQDGNKHRSQDLSEPAGISE
nr:ferredoxin [Mycobacterium paraense]